MNPYRFYLGVATIIVFVVALVMAVAPPFEDEGAGSAFLLAVGLGVVWLAVGAVGWEIRRAAGSQPGAGAGPTD